MKAKPSLLFDNFSGKLGSALVKDTQRGIVITRAGKVQTYNSSYAIARKNAIRGLSQYWSDANVSLREQYAALCPYWKYFDRYGNEIQPTPYGLFVKLNFIPFSANETIVGFPSTPGEMPLPIVDFTVFSLEAQNWTITLDPNGISSGYYVIYATKPCNVPPFFQRDLTRIIDIIPFTGTYEGNQYTHYVNRWGVPGGTWMKFGAVFTIVSDVTGQESAWNQAIQTITFGT